MPGDPVLFEGDTDATTWNWRLLFLQCLALVVLLCSVYNCAPFLVRPKQAEVVMRQQSDEEIGISFNAILQNER